MRAEKFIQLLDAEFYAGVPDSQLKAMCDCLYDQYGISDNHIIAANEGNAIALAAGYHLATGKVPVVYLQNSGLGNIVNPIASLMNRNIYGIPCLLVIGWRGEPGGHDEPQHMFQGKITLPLLKLLEIPAFIIDKNTTEVQISLKMQEYRILLHEGKQAAFVICKDALEYQKKKDISNPYTMCRENIISCILDLAGKEDIFISTTGMTSRELYELREARGEGHERDFLTVGSMGHSSSIALGIALQKPDHRVWCIDGDGAALMHMGAFAITGDQAPKNLIHIVINNGAHESVGGMPTATMHTEFAKIAQNCGYQHVARAATFEQIKQEIKFLLAQEGVSCLEVCTALGVRKNLGRPKTTPIENKMDFMKYLQRNKE